MERQTVNRRPTKRRSGTRNEKQAKQARQSKQSSNRNAAALPIAGALAGAVVLALVFLIGRNVLTNNPAKPVSQEEIVKDAQDASSGSKEQSSKDETAGDSSTDKDNTGKDADADGSKTSDSSDKKGDTSSDKKSDSSSDKDKDKDGTGKSTSSSDSDKKKNDDGYGDGGTGNTGASGSGSAGSAGSGTNGGGSDGGSSTSGSSGSTSGGTSGGGSSSGGSTSGGGSSSGGSSSGGGSTSDGGSSSGGSGTGTQSNQPQALSDANDAQLEIVNTAKTTPATASGYAAEWIEDVFRIAGYGTYTGNACDLYDGYCDLTNLGDLKVGMIVAVRQHTKTDEGSKWGHVCLYVGDGNVMHCVDGTVKTTSLSDWIDYYTTTCDAKWGWLGESLI